MNNYLEYKKEQVRYWAKIGALTLTLTPIFIKPTPWSKDDWEELSGKQKLFILGFLIVLAAITYYSYYYTLSSMFWPQSLSLMNWILLVPFGWWSFFGLKRMWNC